MGDPDRPWAVTTRFQRDLLATIPTVDPEPIGADVRRALDGLYDEAVKSSRFYMALDELRERELVAAEPHDENARVKLFVLTDRGERMLSAYAEWLQSHPSPTVSGPTAPDDADVAQDCWVTFPAATRDLLAVAPAVADPPKGLRYVERLQTIYDDLSHVAVYDALDRLADRDLVAVDEHSGRAKTYRLTPDGVAVRTDYIEWVADRAAAL